MHTTEFEELAGRIDALSHALLHVAAELEVMQLINAPRLTKAWRELRMCSQGTDLRRESAHTVLSQLACLLEQSRSHRDSRSEPQLSGSRAHY
ncbi:MAG: hypothetical protein RSD57_14650 [Comamonas sp.]